MAEKIEKKEVTYDHPVDRMPDKRDPIPANPSATPNASLSESVRPVADKNRLDCQYVVGKSPTEKYVSPGTIESMRPTESGVQR